MPENTTTLEFQSQRLDGGEVMWRMVINQGLKTAASQSLPDLLELAEEILQEAGARPPEKMN